ncbi:MAG: hypothetical protein P4L40_03290 [Terracidiphilus sp.]|nr:hypothetical protein [Terracidiphilus sp.]
MSLCVSLCLCDSVCVCVCVCVCVSVWVTFKFQYLFVMPAQTGVPALHAVPLHLPHPRHSGSDPRRQPLSRRSAQLPPEHGRNPGCGACVMCVCVWV